jgi:hypothetical protein
MRRALGTIAVALAAGAGCHRGAAPAAESARRVRVAPAPLRVDNHYRADVVVSLLHNGVRARLGTVVTAGTGNFRIPASYVDDPGGFYVIADPVGGTPLRSERIVVREGERVVWTLESDLTRSSLGIY